MSEHTPGPWEVARSGKAIRNASSVDFVRAMSTLVELNPPRRRAIGQAERDANARLIAAAPDLLAACEDDVRQLHALADRLAAPVSPGHVDYINKKSAAEALRAIATERAAAIAKARRQA